MNDFTGIHLEGRLLYQAFLARETDLASVTNITFDVSEDVIQQGVRVVVLAMSGLRNREGDADFESLKKQSFQKILASLSDSAIREDPILQGYRNIHTELGFSNRNFPAAAEVLLEYLFKNKQLPHVNLLVDIYNLVSVETRLSLGAHDIRKISGNVHLRTTTGSEGYIPLGATGPKPVRPGGYAYVDDANDVICLLEVKQVEKTKVTVDTTDCLFILQGNTQTDQETIRSAAYRLMALVEQFCGGQGRFLYPT